MHKVSEATLVERAGYLYRQLLLLRRVFQGGEDRDDPCATPDAAEARALRDAVRELLEQLAEHARILTTVPFPIRDWRPGDGADDERWRAMTDVERRELLSLVAAHDQLIAIVERGALRGLDPAERNESGGTGPRTVSSSASPDADEVVSVERVRIARFRQDMPFLDRRRVGRE